MALERLDASGITTLLAHSIFQQTQKEIAGEITNETFRGCGTWMGQILDGKLLFPMQQILKHKLIRKKRTGISKNPGIVHKTFTGKIFFSLVNQDNRFIIEMTWYLKKIVSKSVNFVNNI